MPEKNKVFPVIFRGAGAYSHYIPSIVKSVLSKETLYTAYTPYQAEISQGILQSIYEYQTMICELTGMDAANASVYDGAAAAAEAVAMCRDRKKNRAFVSAAVHPQVMETIKTYCFGNGIELTVIPEKDGVTDLDFLKKNLDSQAACVYIQNPNYYGSLEPSAEIGSMAKEAGARYIMGVNPISLGIIKTPAEYGADIAVGEGQPLGLPLAFGGPYIGFMACTKELTRKLPGRIVGETVDSNGKTGYVLTLQAREQHIRREKSVKQHLLKPGPLCIGSVSLFSGNGSRRTEAGSHTMHVKGSLYGRPVGSNRISGCKPRGILPRICDHFKASGRRGDECTGRTWNSWRLSFKR